MIAYEELVDALANWRTKNGMQSRASRYNTPAPEDTNVHAAVPENDFQRHDGTGEIDLENEAELMYGEDEE